MRAAAQRIASRLGRRGHWLILWGVGWIAYGYGTVSEPQTDRRGLGLVTTLAPLHCWAWGWIGAGTLALAFAWLPAPWDWPGFILAVFPPLMWATSYFTAGATGGLPRGPYAGGLFLVIALAVVLSSLTREYSVPHRRNAPGP